MNGSTVYYVAQSLDGFIADRHGSLNWLLEFGFDDFQEQYDAFLAGVGAIVMGAGTFRWLAEEGEPWAYSGTPTWVVARDALPSIAGAQFERSDDPDQAIADARVASGGRDVWVVGGGMLAAHLIDVGTIDRLHLTIMPVTLGEGTPLLPHVDTLHRWQLDSAGPIGAAGAIELRYTARSS